MAVYDYRCRTCDSVFEVRRPVTADAGEVQCPCGHDDVSRVWSAVAVATGARGGEGAALPAAAAAGGGCCGGACGCGG
jgi:putative FmdB family regulatory protein